MQSARNRRRLVYFIICCTYLCFFATLNQIWLAKGEGSFLFYIPASWANYEINIVDDHPCANFPNTFLIQIENTGPVPIESYSLDSIFTVTSVEKQTLTAGSSGIYFLPDDGNDCQLSLPSIEAGATGYVYASIYNLTPGDIATEISLRLCLRDFVWSCKTEQIPYITKTPIQDKNARSDFEISFVGLFPCDAFDGETAVFKIKNMGETILHRLEHIVEDEDLDYYSSVLLSDTWQPCNTGRAILEPGDESLLLLLWRRPLPAGSHVQATFTLCSPMHHYIDTAVPCPSRDYTLTIPDD